MKISYVAWVIILAANLLVSRTEALSLDEVVDRIQERYEQTEDFSADFQQSSLLGSLKKEQNAAGHVYIQKPGKMRWEYHTPEQQFLVSDGETLWVYTPGLGQVIENQFSTAYDSKTPALFLAGLGNIKEDFEIHFNSEKPSTSEEGYVLKLKPKDPQLYLSKLIITVNRKGFLVEKSTAYDPLGNVITLWFSNIRTNVGLSTSTFQIQVPEGIERIRPPTFPLNP